LRAKPKRGKAQYSSGFAGEAISVAGATAFAKEIVKSDADIAGLTSSIRAICDDYKTYTARVEPSAAEQRASLRRVSAKAGKLYRLLNALDWACREKLSSAYFRIYVVPKGAKRPSPRADIEVVRRLESALAEAAGYDKLPTREDETSYLRHLVRKLALEWEKHTGKKFTMGKQGFGSPAGQWIKAIVAEIDRHVSDTTVNGALVAALAEIRRDRADD
jgi:hypothetical protein